MISAIIKKENIKGLSATYDKLAERYPLTVDAVAQAAKYAAGNFFSCVAMLLVNTLTVFAQTGRCTVIAWWCVTP